MESIKVTILGKQIPLKVKESEIENTRRIAAYVDEKFKNFRSQLANQPDSTVMTIACLSIAEEVFELRAKINEKEGKESEAMESVNKELEKLVEEIS
ncbi:MAG: cell division protein ZapA [Balneolaceae bacterium]|nr:cell division protein ZapA [Balneolaceae bacterium]MCH8549849.1 cell division protein ZapA [Balneolaceae bacterium]